MRLSSAGSSPQNQEGERRVLNSDLWHVCAGPLVLLPAVGSRVVYFPQGHSEQVAATTNKEVDAHIPNYPSLPPQLICQLHNVIMHADIETDEVYAQMTLQPLSPQEQKEAYLPAELGTRSKQPMNYFCKTLTASDTSTHGGFSVPRRAAEKVFPPLDFSQQPPVQELVARDLHDNEWKFRHIFRGQPKRHLLTTGWSVFVSAKRLVAGDSVLFIWNEKNQLLLGIRRACRPPTVMPSSVLSSDSMHLDLLAAAAHATTTNSCFSIFYNPRASPSEFVIPLAKYVKAAYHTRVSVGMRFRMLFETEESSVRRYMGTITGISDLDSTRWRNSHWRSVKVGWDEATAGDRQPRVSLWEIEPLTTFPMYPSPFPLSLKRPWPTGLPAFNGIKDDEIGLNSPLNWLRGDVGDRGIQSLNFPGTGVAPWMQPRLDGSMLAFQSEMYQAMAAAALQEIRASDPSKLLQFQQAQNLPGRSPSRIQTHMLQSSQSQPAFLHTEEESPHHSQAQTQTQLHVLPQQMNQQKPFSIQQQQQLVDHQIPPSSISNISQFVSASQSPSPSVQTLPSLFPKKSFSESMSNPVINPVISPLDSLFCSFPPDESTQLLNLARPNSFLPSSSWPSKRATVDPLLSSSASRYVTPDLGYVRSSQNNISQDSISLPPFPAQDCTIDPGGTDTQGHLLVGASLLMQNGMSSLRGVGSDCDSTTLPFCSNYMNTAEATNFTGTPAMVPATDFAGNPGMAPASCFAESSFMQFTGNVGQVNPQMRTFVKVYKSGGSFGRSLDITKFSSYHELRSELARLFGLEGELEDPLRSGWQLVFVDRENDVLLLGDGPWPEFVNSVWCIKILSSQEVQEMGKRGLELLNSAPIQRLSNSSCDNHATRQDSRNLAMGITSVGSIDY